jgi:hypothetical protein
MSRRGHSASWECPLHDEKPTVTDDEVKTLSADTSEFSKTCTTTAPLYEPFSLPINGFPPRIPVTANPTACRALNDQRCSRDREGNLLHNEWNDSDYIFDGLPHSFKFWRNLDFKSHRRGQWLYDEQCHIRFLFFLCCDPCGHACHGHLPWSSDRNHEQCYHHGNDLLHNRRQYTNDLFCTLHGADHGELIGNGSCHSG